MEDTLEIVKFLASSPNRVRVLDALSPEPTTRSEIQSATDVSRSTALRTIDECESRGWVESEGSQYWITPLGEQTLAAFLSYLETADGVRHVGEAVDWMPEPVLSVDFRHFRDATIVTPTPAEPAAPFDHGLDIIQRSESFRVLASTALPRYVEAIEDRLAEGTIQFEGVTAASYYREERDDHGQLELSQALVDRSWSFDGRVPINLHLADEAVLVWLGGVVDGDLEMYGLLESANPAVLSWAESLYAEYRADAEPLDAETLSGE